MNEGIKSGVTDLPLFGVGNSLQVVTSSQVITAVSTSCTIQVQGGGSGGSAGDVGGESGGYVLKRLDGLSPGVTQITIVIGAAGVGAGTNNSPLRTSGGQTSVTISGVTPLVAGGGNATAQTGGTATGGDINIPGGKGYFGGYSGSGSNFLGGMGASSFMGWGGRGSGTTNGDDANGAGAGGGGGFRNNAISTDFPGGAGTAGRVVINWERSS